MAKLIYDDDGRLLFTEEMKKEYKILMPMMLPIHFTFMQKIFAQYGYNVELLSTKNSNIVNEGLQNVHNDTCYPALLVVGQFLDAIKSGKYDLDKTALIMTQTGGGCRASNYIHLIRKALKKNGLEKIPVISFNIPGMERNPGFKLSISIIFKFVNAVVYGDVLMLLSNQTRPYELNKGETDELVQQWTDKLVSSRNGLSRWFLRQNLKKIVTDFAKIPLKDTKKIKVGVVGEIYVKYAPLANNNLEEFLQNEGAEVVVPGVLDFVIFMADNHVTDTELYGIKKIKGYFSWVFEVLLRMMQNELVKAVKKQPKFRAPPTFAHIKKLIKGYVSKGNKMGEGWLLTAEMLELVSTGIKNIVCTQPFGCLPNHIVGKGMIRSIRMKNEGANIVAIDYDPGATRINQENRIKLMLATAKQNMDKQLTIDNGPSIQKNAAERSQNAF